MSLDIKDPQPPDDEQPLGSSGGAEQTIAPALGHSPDKSIDVLDPETVAAAQRMLLGLKLPADPAAGANRPEPGDPILEELADDVLQLLRRMSAFEQRFDGLVTGIERLGSQINEGVAASARQTDALRRDLLGDRRAVAVSSAFGVAVSALDSLTAMQAGVDPEQDRRVLDQLAAVTSALTSLLERLGFIAFEAVPGEAFDPTRMRCLGFIQGTPGLVLAAVSAGYAAGGTVVRPAGVLIADPANPNQPTEGSVS